MKETSLSEKVPKVKAVPMPMVDRREDSCMMLVSDVREAVKELKDRLQTYRGIWKRGTVCKQIDEIFGEKLT